MTQANLENRNKYALITGATNGIGFELAKLFANDGYNLVLVARNKNRLSEVTDHLKEQFSVEITPLSKDLYNPYAAEEIYEKTKDMGITINVLVNDAGHGEWGPFIETDIERDLEIIQLNIASVVSLTKYFLHDMVSRNEGKILILGSEASTASTPLPAVQAGMKSFAASFTSALVTELKDKAITITYCEKSLTEPVDAAKDGYEALQKGGSVVLEAEVVEYEDKPFKRNSL